MPEKQLRYEDFKDRVGSVFTVRDDGFPQLELKLDEAVLTTNRGAPAETRPSFNLMFVGAAEPVLPQKTYSLEHAELGQVAIFLVPVAKNARGVFYQAVFN